MRRNPNRPFLCGSTVDNSAELSLPVVKLLLAGKAKRKVRVCKNCGKSATTTKRCGGCKLVRYCSQDFLNEDWKEHTAECKKGKAREEGGKGKAGRGQREGEEGG